LDDIKESIVNSTEKGEKEIMKRHSIKMLALLIALQMLAAPVFAGEASPWKDAGSTQEQIEGKLIYGLKNFTLGWTAFFKEKGEMMDEGNYNIVDCLASSGRGLVKAVAYTVGGALHLATFPIPCIDIPIPDGGTDII